MNSFFENVNAIDMFTEGNITFPINLHDNESKSLWTGKREKIPVEEYKSVLYVIEL